MAVTHALHAQEPAAAQHAPQQSAGHAWQGSRPKQTVCRAVRLLRRVREAETNVTARDRVMEV